jgi:DNA-binding HxlR family transcriptional regulator
VAVRKAVLKAPEADVFAGDCPSRAILDHVSSRWGVLVLLALRPGTLRFGELGKRINGVSEKMLAQTLVALERDGFVERTAHAVIPPRVDYRLTPLGEELAERVEGLVRFVEGKLPNVDLAQRAYDARRK